MDETSSQALPFSEPWTVLSGPSNNIFDDIFDWIANSIRTITGFVQERVSWLFGQVNNALTSWISWLWGSITNWLYWVRDQVWSRLDYVLDQVRSGIDNVGTWLSGVRDSITDFLRFRFSELSGLLDWLRSQIVSTVQDIGQSAAAGARSFYEQISGQLTSLGGYLSDIVTVKLDQVIVDIRELFPEWIRDPGKYAGVFLDGVAGWLQEDIPGHSPRWTGIFESIFNYFKKTDFYFLKWWLEDPSERVAYGLQSSFQWVSDTIDPVIETFNNAVFSFARSLGPMSPDQAATNFSSLSKIGFTAISGLIGMTVAGELLHPLKRIGLGNIAAVVWDMTNYKMITGAFIGAMTYSMLQTPLRYYFNSLFLPNLLQERDFTELLSRKAFSDPDTLQNDELSASIKDLAPAGGAAFEKSMLSYYGYRPEYVGLFRELANTRLGYFALAGVARSGFWDEPWFREALARTGYSKTAASALLVMMKELYNQSKLQPVLGQIRRLFREGFTTRKKAEALMAEAIDLPELADVRLLAMDLEQQYETKSLTLDISLRAFSRGVISESECRHNLSDLDLPGTMIGVHLDREKLGLIRRISWTPPEGGVQFQIVEEG